MTLQTSMPDPVKYIALFLYYVIMLAGYNNLGVHKNDF